MSEEPKKVTEGKGLGGAKASGEPKKAAEAKMSEELKQRERKPERERIPKRKAYPRRGASLQNAPRRKQALQPYLTPRTARRRQGVAGEGIRIRARVKKESCRVKEP